MDNAKRALGLMFATLCAAGVAGAPQPVLAAGIDATVSHRNLQDGPVRIELADGVITQGTPSYVMLGSSMGRVQLYIENISKPTEVSCILGQGAPAEKQKRVFTVVERYREGAKTFATGKTLSITAGDYTPLKFVVVPNPAGTYIYTIKAAPLGNASFVECKVRTLADEPSSAVRGSAKAARSTTRTSPRRPGARLPPPSAARIAGARTLRRLSRKAQRDAGLEPRSPRGRQTAPTPPASHSFGPSKFTSDSKKASLLTAQFYSLTAAGMLMNDVDQLVAMVAVPKTKTAVVDCDIQVFGQPGAGELSITVEQSAGPSTSYAFKNGDHHLVFGLIQTIGLETFAIKTNDADVGGWVLRQCEVEFH